MDGGGNPLVQVLQKGNILGDAYKGLAHGRNGLGIRVLQEDYADCGKKLIPDFVSSTDNSFMYEISKVPLWVNADNLIGQLMATISWMVDFVRTLRAQGEFKTILVRGNIAAPQDCMLQGNALLLIQKARPAPRSNVSVSLLWRCQSTSYGSEGKQSLKRKLLCPRRKILQTSRGTEGISLIILLLGLKAQPNGERTVYPQQ